ncbi:uncharacterized protein BJ212DRAFT_1343765 [Suillus subaureus]|uniref:Uncharacterized protein n=1 Tax=Suillus subaureus TaxID=48587 RepID=A0A9P7EEZ6_9AGAM|nr:uncharacterized protein BJ212DRAFT_1343765 [Suillus subaureus]KAG1818998.1 hypothetical protein BJ212DRAFT_1343765 [Suillus subaureus]
MQLRLMVSKPACFISHFVMMLLMPSFGSRFKVYTRAEDIVDHTRTVKICGCFLPFDCSEDPLPVLPGWNALQWCIKSLLHFEVFHSAALKSKSRHLGALFVLATCMVHFTVILSGSIG